MSATTIADVINVARDMTITALDAGEPVAWLSRATGTPNHPYYGHLHAAVPVRRSANAPITGWVVRVKTQGPVWLLVSEQKSKPKPMTVRAAASRRSKAPNHGGVAWSTEAVRGAVLRSLAVVDPSNLPQQAVQPVPPPEDDQAAKKLASKAARLQRTAEAKEAFKAFEANSRNHALQNIHMFMLDVADMLIPKGSRATKRAARSTFRTSAPKLVMASRDGDSPFQPECARYFAFVIRRGLRRVGVVLPGTEVDPSQRGVLCVVVTLAPTDNDWANWLYRTRNATNTWKRAVESVAQELST